VKLEDIPRRQEVLIVAEAQQRIDRVVVSEHFDRRVASLPRSRTSPARYGSARYAARQ
jgi:hypothetical protein